MDDFERRARETSIRISEEGDVLPLQDDPNLYQDIDDDEGDDPEEIDFDESEDETNQAYAYLLKKFKDDIESRRQKGKPARVQWLGSWIHASKALQLARKNNRYRDITPEQWESLANEIRTMGLQAETTRSLGKRVVQSYSYHADPNRRRLPDWAERAAGDIDRDDD